MDKADSYALIDHSVPAVQFDRTVFESAWQEASDLSAAAACYGRLKTSVVLSMRSMAITTHMLRPVWSACCALRYRTSNSLSCSVGGLFGAWVFFNTADFRFTGAQPQGYRSSASVRRGFCPECGSPMYYLPGGLTLQQSGSAHWTNRISSSQRRTGTVKARFHGSISTPICRTTLPYAELMTVKLNLGA